MKMKRKKSWLVIASCDINTEIMGLTAHTAADAVQEALTEWAKDGKQDVTISYVAKGRLGANEYVLLS